MNCRQLSILSAVALGSMLQACGGGGGDDSSDATTMCYVKSGNTLSVNCKANSLGTCAAEGKVALGSYDKWSTCNIDAGSVLQAFSSTGAIAAGPQSKEATSGAGGGGTGGGGSSANADALNFPKVPYSFTCAAGGSKTVNVSNGPCISSEKAFTKASTCNEYDSDFTFNSVGRPFFQCLVNNSTGDFKSTYEQSLKYYGG